MRTLRIVLVLALGLVGATALWSQRLAIGQVDTGRLLFGQRVDLFLSVDLPSGAEPELGNFQVFESAGDGVFREVDALLDLAPVSALDEPLSFYMLVDNSGSMYDETVPGRPDLRRIDAARAAIRDFANTMTNERDRIGLAVFNTGYEMLQAPTTEKAGIGGLLESIEEPAREQAYTELYAALVASAEDASAAGRRTVIVLSDGENYPYSVFEGEPSPVYGERLFTHTEAIEAFQREGLSLFVIHYGDREDPNLDEIAAQTGGSVYRASGPDELGEVYRDIRAEILEEYRLSYRATMIPAQRRIVRVTWSGTGRRLTAERPYFASTLFAGRGAVPPALLGVLFSLGAIGLAALLLVSFRYATSTSSLVVIDSGGARGLEKTIALGHEKTVIGASPSADVTIAGAPGVAEQHATVVWDAKRSEYTISSDAPVRVNNRPTTRRVLKPGDVINIEGTIFAYEEPDEKDG